MESTLSDWSTDDLSHKETMYAALDAWVLVHLLEAIQKDPFEIIQFFVPFKSNFSRKLLK